MDARGGSGYQSIVRLVGVREDPYTGTVDSHHQPMVQQGGKQENKCPSLSLLLPFDLLLMLSVGQSQRAREPS